MRIFGAWMRSGILSVSVVFLVACGGGGSSGGSSPPPGPDTTAPDTTISQSPSQISGSSSATFSFTATEPGSFEGRLDGGAFAAVTSPYVLSGLGDGSHTFEVRARDSAGNVDASPASFSWTIDTAAPQVRLKFPTPRFYTDAATITVRGTAEDPAGVQTLSVNGVAATTSNGFADWSATIDVPAGTTSVEVTSADAAGNSRTSSLAAMENRGAFVHTPAGAAIDPTRQRLLVVDGETDAIVSIRPTDGVGQEFVAGQLPGAASTAGYGEIVVDAANDRALVIAHSADELVEVDLESGARTVVSVGAGPGGQTNLEFARGLTLDSAGNNAFTAANSSIVRINLGNGARNIVITDVPTLALPVEVIFDDVTLPASPRLLVLNGDSTQLGVVAIDVATGTLTNFSTFAAGTGAGFISPIGMTLDAANQRLLVMDAVWGLMAVDLATGNRTRLDVAGISQEFGGLGSGAVTFDLATRHLYVTQSSGLIADIDVDAPSLDLIAGSSFAAPNGVGNGVEGLAIEQVAGTPASLITMSGGPAGRVMRFDLATGNGTLLSDSFDVGLGPMLDTPLDMILDRSNDRALIAQGYIVAEPRFVAVDLESGDRTVLVSDDGSGELGIPWRFAYDASANRLVYLRIDPLGGATELHAVNLAGGDTSVLSGAAAGGPGFGSTGQIVFESAQNPTRALMTDLASNRILSVDLVTGARSVFNTVEVGNSGSLFIDSENSRVFVSNVAAPMALITVPLSPGGARTLISGLDPVSSDVRGGGPALHSVERIDVDVANGVVYAASRGNGALFAVDVSTGDRVVIAR